MAYQRYQLLLKKYILENLWNMHPPFQIDGNLGGTAGVAEMLIQSHEGYINPLPALPAAWRDGSYEGLVARGNFVVSVFWKQGLMTQMNVLSRAGGECVIQYKDIANFTIKDAKGKKVKTIRESKNRIRFAPQKGNTYYLNH